MMWMLLTGILHVCLGLIRGIFIVKVRYQHPDRIEEKKEPCWVIVLMYGSVLFVIVAVNLCAYVRIPGLDDVDSTFLDQEPLRWAGFALAVIGLVLFTWVHIHLDNNWTGIITKVKDHKLIVTGPYQIARHPMYLSIWLFIIGIFFLSLKPLILIAWIIHFAYPTLRFTKEEALMLEMFGNQYVEYKQNVGAFCPCTFIDCGASVEQRHEQGLLKPEQLPPAHE